MLDSLPFSVDVILLNSLLLMLTAKAAKLMVEKVVLHGLLLVLRMLAEHACNHILPCNVEVVLLNILLLMLHMLTAKPAKLIVEKVVPHSLLLVVQMPAASQQNSSKGRGGWHVWHTLKFPPSQNGVQ